MNKEETVRLLGFRDAKGTLIDLTTVIDLTKVYRVCLSTVDGSWKPSAPEMDKIGNLLKELGVKGAVFAESGVGGFPLFNKVGALIGRVVESRIDVLPAVPPKTLEKEAPKPEVSEPEKKEASFAFKKKKAVK